MYVFVRAYVMCIMRCVCECACGCSVCCVLCVPLWLETIIEKAQHHLHVLVLAVERGVCVRVCIWKENEKERKRAREGEGEGEGEIVSEQVSK